MLILLFSLAAYLIGSLSFAVIVSRAFGLPDPHTYGSGNPGATNVLRTGRKAAALITLLGDGGKGWLAVFLAQILAPQYGVVMEVVAAAALAVFLGHLWPVFFKFRGGKGVATALGILLALNAWLGLAVLATWLAVFAMFRISSLAAVTASVLAPVYGLLLMGANLQGAAVVVMSVLLLVRHRENIRRLLSGEEGNFRSRQGGPGEVGGSGDSSSGAP